MLEQIGPRLRAVLRAGDMLARLGGDEFAAVLADAARREPVGRRIARALEEGLRVDGIDVRIGASIGIAVFPEHGDDAETLMQRADVAMYQAKAARSGHAFYQRERDRHSRERLELIGELRDAIGTEQIILHFQPKLDLDSGRIDDVEALVRWMHPERGLLGPGAFVPLAEQTGVMRELTEHVLDAALHQIAAWYETGLDLSVAVNVSAATLLDEGWATDIGTALVRHGVPASRLRIEITEDTLMADPERALRVVEDLVAMGIGVSIDDFGTGYSSLGLLKHLPVDELKIDRAFVRDLLHDEADAAIVQSVVDLGRRLGLRDGRRGDRGRGDARVPRRVRRDARAGLPHRPAAPGRRARALRHRRARHRLTREPRSRRCGERPPRWGSTAARAPGEWSPDHLNLSRPGAPS